MADYSEQQLVGALRKADAAGDVTAAKAIARRIQSMRQATPAQADFSDVQSSVTQSQPEAAAGPLAPSVYGERNAPSLDTVNA